MKISQIFSGLVFALSFSISSCKYKDEVEAVQSIKKIDDGVYFMEFEGDYGFDSYLEQGGARNIDELSGFLSRQLQKGMWKSPSNQDKKAKQVKITPVDFGCSSIAVNNIFGRNYDWKDCKVLVVHTKPNNGYESVSTCCLSHIGIGEDWEPSGTFFKDIFLLPAIYVPMDGMNEKGLYIADLIVGGENEEPTNQERGNVNVTTTDAIRLVLDKAATVDEALKLLENHDMHSVIGREHHFAIADKTGKAVAVEWANNQMFVKETNVLTNHYVTESPKKDDGKNEENGNSRSRLEKLAESSKAAAGKMSADEVAGVLKSVSAGQYGYDELTVWSAVFEPENQKITYFFKEKYDSKVVLELK